MNRQVDVARQRFNANRLWAIVGAMVCLLSVVIGAFAAHSLKTTLSDYQIGIVGTGAQYQMYHGLAILISSLLFLALQTPTKLIHFVNSAFAAGCLLFPISLYCLALTEVKMFAYFTPLGGLFFIIGWCLLIWAIVKSPKQT